MLISHRKKFIYTKTSKTASTSVESYFELYCMPEGEWQFQHAHDEYESEAGVIGFRGPMGGENKWFHHMSATSIRAQVGEDTWKNYFKFSVIRNPYDRLISAYFFAEKPTGSEEKLVCGFRKWVRDCGEVSWRHTYCIKGDICLDYFIRYEELESGIQHVCSVLNVPYEENRLPRLKANFREQAIPLSTYYDNETREKVGEKYAFELDYFGYRFPESD